MLIPLLFLACGEKETTIPSSTPTDPTVEWEDSNNQSNSEPTSEPTSEPSSDTAEDTAEPTSEPSSDTAEDTAEPTSEPSSDTAEDTAEPTEEVSTSFDGHDFGPIGVGTDVDVDLSLSNDTLSDLTITALNFSDTAFSLAPSSTLEVGSVLVPEVTESLTLRFTPAAATTYSGTLTIETDSSIAPSIEINLQGEGLASQ